MRGEQEMVFPSGHDRSAAPTGGDGDGRPIWFFQTVTSIIIIIIIIIVIIVITITIIIILHHHHHDSAPARGDGRPIWFSQNSHRDAGSMELDPAIIIIYHSVKQGISSAIITIIMIIIIIVIIVVIKIASVSLCSPCP